MTVWRVIYENMYAWIHAPVSPQRNGDIIPLRWVVSLNLALDQWPENSRDPPATAPVCSGSRCTGPSPGLHVGTKNLNPSPHSNPASIPH